MLHKYKVSYIVEYNDEIVATSKEEAEQILRQAYECVNEYRGTVENIEICNSVEVEIND